MRTFDILVLDFFRFAIQLTNGWRVQHELDLARRRERDLAPYLERPTNLRILDLANGRLRPQSALLDAAGHWVCGIDLVNRPQINLTEGLYGLARWIYQRRIYAARQPSKIKLVCGDVGFLPFRGAAFDVVTSVAAFEHFLQVPWVVAELGRVLRPGGLTWVLIHPFTALSGGHNVKLLEVPLRSLPRGVQPWDHLRQRRLPFHVPLNEWRPAQYLDAFRRHFEILQAYCALREGEHFLTPAIRAELSTYTADELTCGAYVIVARKPG